MLKPITATLRAARALIGDPRRWTQGGEPLFKGARDARGQQCDPDDPRATAWCALAAIAKVEPNSYGQRLGEKALGAGLWRAFGWGCSLDPASFNDDKTHEDVLEMFDAAIEEQQLREIEQEPSARDLLAMRAEAKAFMSKFIGEAEDDAAD